MQMLRYLLVLSFGTLLPAQTSPVAVWTHHNDNARTGANLQETVLNTSNITSQSFGKLFSFPVDGEIYAQPLYLPQLKVSGKGRHNVVFVATMNDSVYAFDADSNTGTNSAPLWFVNFTNPAAGITPVPAEDLQSPGNFNIHGVVGILSTPVIDTTAGTIFVLARTKENGSYFQRLHALDIASGAERANSPITVNAQVKGTGYDAQGGVLFFNPLLENQRPALALSNGVVYVAWASLNDRDPYHGWLIGYNAATLAQVAVYNDSPDGGRGGIWQSGNGPAITTDGSLIVLSGNGDWNGASNLGNCFIKLAPGTLAVTDFFTPADWQHENDLDLDLGGSGPLLLPNTNLVIGGGKEGRLFVVPTNAMGHLEGSGTPNVQVFQATDGHIHGAPVYWQSPSAGPLIYVWGEESTLRAFHFNGATFDTIPAMQSTFSAPPGMPGGILSLSANGAQAGSGVLWAAIPVSSDAERADVPGVLRAFDASDLSHELWNSLNNKTRDDLGLFAKYSPPTVANGKVYLATFSNQLVVYGLFNNGLPDFTITSNAPAASLIPGVSTAHLSIHVTPLNGLTTPVALKLAGLPAGASATFSPSSVTGDASSVLTIRASASTPLGAYPLKLTASAGSLSHPLPLKLFVNATSGTLSLSVATPAGTQNLTAAGTADWIHWGLGTATAVNRKAGVSPSLSSFQLIGTAPLLGYNNNPFGFSWTDGTPTSTVPFTANGVYVVGENNGFRLTAPADLTPRTLTVYAGVYRAAATVVAGLSDYSAVKLVDTSVTNLSGQLSVAYTFTYAAASPGQTVTVAIVESPGATDPFANVTLQAATLNVASPAPSAGQP